jgi:tetratricopeptide (TPR) repeat protein
VGILLLLGFQWWSGNQIFLAKKSPDQSLVETHPTSLVPPFKREPNHSSKSMIDAIKTPTIKANPPLQGIPQNASPETLSLVLLMQAKFATGDFEGSLGIAQEILKKPDPSGDIHPYINNQMPFILASSGWTQLRLGRYEQAIEQFLSAQKITPMIEATKGLALAYYKLHKIAEAVDQTERYLAKSPQDAALYVVLSDLYESQNRFGDSVQVLEKAEAAVLAQGGPELSQNLALVRKQKRNMQGRAEVSKSQKSEATDAFKLTYTEAEHDSVAGWVLATLQDSLDEFIGIYGLKYPSEPIEVLLYDRSQFKSTTEDIPQWVDGLFADGRIRVPLSGSAYDSREQTRLRSILRHELVHALLARASDQRKLPTWFDEGLAQRFSCPVPSCTPFTFPFNNGHFLKPADFLIAFTSIPDALHVERAYKQSLYLILTIENTVGEYGIRTMIDQIKRDSPLDSDSILQPLGLTFDQLVIQASVFWKKGETFSRY